MTSEGTPTGTGGAPEHEHEHVSAEDVLDAVVGSALEHGDGGDGGAAPSGGGGGRAARLITVFGLVLGGAAVFFVVRRLIKDWPEVEPYVHDANYAWLAFAGVCAVLGMSSIGWGWRHVMRTLGAEPRFWRTIAWYYVGELGKYVPGGVWPVLGRGELARRGGIPRSRAFTSVALSLGMLYLAAMFTAAAFLPFAVAGKKGGFSPWMLVLLALPVGVVLLHHDVLDWLMAKASKATKRDIKVEVPQWRDSLILVARYIPTWIFIGTATYAVTRSITADVSYPHMVFATILSWTVGFLAVPVPSGAGIRETVLYAAAGVPKPIAITTAVGARIIFVIVDVAGAAVCAPFVRRAQGPIAGEPEPEPEADSGTTANPL
ncbi:lysylphosphatidylglycerol synthase transmembrane domain-containing protein [Aquihabitans sp. McL0605]|uniref:lysylphosphatidylglycerol synthase transmembrane domain-containing protein n=1 Tax=Aquihabitans sp. McL0605 TaxID=3415671 RepID=UPI003CF46C42